MLYDLARGTIRGGFFLFFGTAFSTVILALSSILIARLIGPGSFGLYNNVMIIPALFITLCDLGISPAIVRFSALHKSGGRDEKAAKVVQTAFELKLPFSALMSLILIFFSDWIALNILNRPTVGPLIQITSMYLFGQAIIESIHSTFIGLDMAGKAGFFMILNSLLRITISLLLIMLGMGVSGAVYGMSLSAFLTAGIASTFILIKVVPKLKGNSVSDFKETFSNSIKKMIGYGSPLYISALILAFQGELRRIFLAYFSSDESIGNFATAVNFSALITVLASPIASVLFPAFSKLDINKEPRSMDKIYKLSIKYTSLIIVPVSVSLIVLSKYIVSFLYGPRYEIASIYLAQYMLTFLPVVLGMYVIESLLNSQADTKKTFKMKIISILSSIPLALLLIPLYGPSGLIVSILISLFFSTAYGVYQVYKLYRIQPDWSSSVKILVSSILSTLPVYIVFAIFPIKNVIIGLLFGGFTYLLCLLIFLPFFGALNLEDIENLRNMIEDLPIAGNAITKILQLEKILLIHCFSKIYKI